GGNAGRAAFSGTGTTYGLKRAAAAVTHTFDGEHYTIAGRVRADAPGRAVCLRVREWDAGTFIGEARTCLTAGTAWQQASPATYAVLGAGHRLFVDAYATGALTGDSFETDNLTLA